MKIIVANWKAYVGTFQEALKLFEMYKSLASYKRAAFVLAPPQVFLRSLSKSYKGRRISFATQGLGHAGACTGCTSSKQAKDAGADLALIGHSEQRAQGLTDEQIADILPEAIAEKVYPILIVGEYSRSQSAEHFRFVKAQIKKALSKYPKTKAAKFMIAYEPVWAVGAKRPLKSQDIEMMMIYIRKTLVQIFGERKGRKIPILYGGSVNAASVSAILDLQEVSGVLLGRASVNTKELQDLYNNIKT